MSGARDAARGAASAGGAAARAGRRATRGTSRLISRFTDAGGAGQSGLGGLIRLTAAGSVGDGFVAVSLAGTIFFNTSVDQARSKVVLFLIITITPFALLAPFIGPMLDRVQDGRRYILAGTLMARGLLCWGMSAAVKNPLTLLPSAFGILVLQKAYGVARASIAPRLLPPDITLVKANARSALASLIATAIAASLAAGVDKLCGAAWVLRLATVIYIAAMTLALRLPSHVDSQPAEEPTQPLRFRPGRAPADPDGRATASPDGRTAAAARPRGTRPYRRARPDPGSDAPPIVWDEDFGPGDGYRPDDGYGPAAGDYGPDGEYYGPDGEPIGYDRPVVAAATAADGGADGGKPAGQRRERWRTLTQVGPIVGEAMRGNATLRALSGYMIFFLIFVLRTDHFHGVSQNFALGGMVGAASIGGIVAMAIGSMLKARAPEFMMFTMLVITTVVIAACAFFFGLLAAIVASFMAALATAIAKLALDSIVQREIGEEIRSSAFGVSETLHQLSWVAGGLAGVAMSFTNSGTAGLALPAVGVGVSLVMLVLRRRRRITSGAGMRRPAPHYPG